MNHQDDNGYFDWVPGPRGTEQFRSRPAGMRAGQPIRHPFDDDPSLGFWPEGVASEGTPARMRYMAQFIEEQPQDTQADTLPASDKSAKGTDTASASANQQAVTGEKKFDVKKYVDEVKNISSNTTQHACAKHIRLGLEAGGASTKNHPVSAKDYGPLLLRNGFMPISSEKYMPQIGDTVVFQPYQGGNINGHIETYDGIKWISDFTQHDFFPGNGYKKSVYQIYRAPR